MSSGWKLVLGLAAAAVGVFVIYRVAMALLSLLVPILVVGAIAVILYSVVSKKALGSGRRHSLR